MFFKVWHAKAHGKNYMKVRPLLVCHLLRNHLLLDKHLKFACQIPCLLVGPLHEHTVNPLISATVLTEKFQFSGALIKGQRLLQNLFQMYKAEAKQLKSRLLLHINMHYRVTRVFLAIKF